MPVSFATSLPAREPGIPRGLMVEALHIEIGASLSLRQVAIEIGRRDGRIATGADQ